jgi:two-component system alkaline phosphatase synthesis response regulator PhoP
MSMSDAPPGSSGSPEGPRKVVYVEDEPAVQRLVRFWLEDAGFDVVLADDGREGLAVIRSELPDLVVTDALMPEMMGDDLVVALKTDPELRAIPVIMATAAASPLRVKRMLDLGCIDVIAKPMEEQSFIAAVKKALGDA